MSFHRFRDMLGVGLMLAEQGQAGLQQRLQFAVLGGRDERRSRARC